MDDVRRAVADVAHLLRFRAATVRRRGPALAGLAAVVLVALAAAVLPAYAELAPGVRADLARMLPAALVAVVLVSAAGAIAGGGGRELLARDPAAVHPVSPVTDHLGALVLAPLNAGWLIQTWALLGLVAAVAGPRGTAALAGAQMLTLTWVLAATALGQLVGWVAEWVRRGPRGVLLVRTAVALALLTGAALGAVPAGREVLVGGPASTVADVVLRADAGAGVAVFAGLMAATGVFVVLGAPLAVAVARRAPRDESRLETRTHPARVVPASDLAMLRRIDRGSVWRSLPLRRGTCLLALAPGLVALAGGLDWTTLVLMPGLVASGCVLLFGVNLWCLDGRGLLWRESLPVAPRTVMLARALVLGEVLLGAGLCTLVLGAVRAGPPTTVEVLAVVLALVVVVGQALSAGLRWSAARPHAVDLRSARATPAPPLTMVGYSIRLACATTSTSLLLTGLLLAGRPDLLVLVAGVLLGVSALRVRRAAYRWSDPVRRAAVVSVVAA